MSIYRKTVNFSFAPTSLDQSHAAIVIGIRNCRATDDIALAHMFLPGNIVASGPASATAKYRWGEAALLSPSAVPVTEGR